MACVIKLFLVAINAAIMLATLIQSNILEQNKEATLWLVSIKRLHVYGLN
jgi:hypothetical protein